MTTAVTTRDADRARAVDCIRELAKHGHAFSYIAKALTLRGIPTLSGRGSWDHSAVIRIARQHGIRAGYGRAA